MEWRADRGQSIWPTSNVGRSQNLVFDISHNTMHTGKFIQRSAAAFIRILFVMILIWYLPDTMWLTLKCYILTSKLQNTLKSGSEASKRLYFTILEKVCISIYWFSDLGRIWPYNNERGKFPIYSYHKKWFNLMCSLS